MKVVTPREMAVMEIPVISIYQAEMLSVDKYLINKGLIKVNPHITYEDIICYLCSKSGSGKEWAILNEGKESFLLIKNLIMELKK